MSDFVYSLEVIIHILQSIWVKMSGYVFCKPHMTSSCSRSRFAQVSTLSSGSQVPRHPERSPH